MLNKILFLVFFAVLASLPAQDTNNTENTTTTAPQENAPLPAPQENPLTEADIPVQFDNPDGAALSTNTINVWDYIRMFLILIALIFAVYLFIKFLRKFSVGTLHQSNNIRLIDSLVLHGEQTLHLVELGDELYFLGSSNGGSISLLDKITNKEQKDRIDLETSPVPRTKNFARLLANNFSSTPRQANSKQLKSFLQKQKEKFKQLKP